jgi:hypothetical protein
MAHLKIPRTRILTVVFCVKVLTVAMDTTPNGSHDTAAAPGKRR